MHTREERMKPSVRSSCVKIYLCSNPEGKQTGDYTQKSALFPELKKQTSPVENVETLLSILLRRQCGWAQGSGRASVPQVQRTLPPHAGTGRQGECMFSDHCGDNLIGLLCAAAGANVLYDAVNIRWLKARDRWRWWAHYKNTPIMSKTLKLESKLVQNLCFITLLWNKVRKTLNYLLISSECFSEMCIFFYPLIYEMFK